MRTLRFIVDGQTIKKDPGCDFKNLYPGTEEYMVAEFSFSPEWDDYVKIIQFFSKMGKAYQPQLLKGNGCCIIPAEALKKEIFKIQVIGRRGEVRISTNKVEIRQDSTGGNT